MIKTLTITPLIDWSARNISSYNHILGYKIEIESILGGIKTIKVDSEKSLQQYIINHILRIDSLLAITLIREIAKANFNLEIWVNKNSVRIFNKINPFDIYEKENFKRIFTVYEYIKNSNIPLNVIRP